MKQIFLCLTIILMTGGCQSKNPGNLSEKPDKTADTLVYPYKATYSSDMTVSSNPAYGQMVLQVWKMFENKQIDSLKRFYADTVTYNNSTGFHFYGSSNQLLDYARKDVEGLDSLRFDISMWQSLHINDKNEDWVYIWAAERRYEKGGKADTALIHEQWKVEHGKVSYFNQYTAKP